MSEESRKSFEALPYGLAIIFMLLCLVMMPNSALALSLAPSELGDEGGIQVDNPALSELRFTYDEKGDFAYPMTPAFQSNVYEYELYVPDATFLMYAWATLDSGFDKDNTPIEISYMPARAPFTEEVIPVASSDYVGAELPRALAGGAQAKTNVFEVNVAGQTYKVTVKRTYAGLTSLQGLVAQAVDVNRAGAQAAASGVGEITVFVDPGAEIRFMPSLSTPTSSSLTVNGAVLPNRQYSTVVPEWGLGKSYDLNMQVSSTLEGVQGLTYVIHLVQKPTELAIVQSPDKLAYRAGEHFDSTGMILKAVYSTGEEEVLSSGDYSISPELGFLPGMNSVTFSYGGISNTLSVSVADMEVDGSGTDADPYLVKSTQDISYLSAISMAGKSFRGDYIKLVNDITLPTNWVPLGAGYDWKPNQNDTQTARFEGTFDGDGHTLTIPEGERPLLGYAGYALVKNLNIYGPMINGNGVLENYVVDYTLKGYPPCDFENITLKSGTKTLKSGLLGGYASGLNQCAIRFCTIEEGVEIGYTGEEDCVGGFAGEFNGEIIGCVNHGTVRGRNFVGGIVADKGQTMGEFKVYDCVFDGTIEASGNYVGGICGAGYGGTNWGWGSAPNTPCVTIRNCMATGSVTGSNYVGGIFGADPCVKCTFGNYIGYIQSNYFGGTLKATATGEDVYAGGIIGYWDSMNNCTIFGDNYYIEGCGADVGIGHVVRVITKDGLTEEELESSDHNLENWYGREDGLTPENASERFTTKVSAEQVADGTLVNLMNSAVNTSETWSQEGEAVALGIGVRFFELGGLGQQARTDYIDYGRDHSIHGNGLRAGSYRILSADWLDDQGLIRFKSDGTMDSIPATQAELTGDLSYKGYRTVDLTYGNLTYTVHLWVDNPIINQEAVDAVISKINTLPSVDDVTVETAASAEDARAALDALGKGEQPLVTNTEKLVAIEVAVEAAVALSEADDLAQAYENAKAAADEAAKAAETARAAAEEAAKTPGEAAVKAAQDAEAAAQSALELAKATQEAAVAAYEAAAKAQELAVTEAGKEAANAAASKADDNKKVAEQAVDDAAKAADKAGATIKAAQTAADKAASDKAAADKAAKLAAASNINMATVKAAQVKVASDLGATTITLGPKVKKIAKGAFKGTKIKTIIVKSKKLKKKSVKGSLKGSKVKTVKVQIGKKKVNKKYVKKYKKIFTKKNAGKKAKVK